MSFIKVQCFRITCGVFAVICLISIANFSTWSQHSIQWIKSGRNFGMSAERLFVSHLEKPSDKFITTTPSTVSPMKTLKSLDDEMSEEQERRHRTLQRVCDRDDIPQYQKQWMEYKKKSYTHHVLVDENHKILFNFVPKVSCTTWKKLFALLTHNNVTQLGKYSDNEIRAKLSTYRKVLFVREPITRLLSAYLSKFQPHDKLPLQMYWEKMYGRKIVSQYRNSDSPLFIESKNNSSDLSEPLLNIKLDEFINFIVGLGNETAMDELRDHWLPIYRVANPCVLKYDFIGHYENLAIEGPFVLRWLGVDDVVSFPTVHDSRAVQSLLQAYQQVPLYLLRRLWEYYKLDYEMFGYSINDTMLHLMTGTFS